MTNVEVARESSTRGTKRPWRDAVPPRTNLPAIPLFDDVQYWMLKISKGGDSPATPGKKRRLATSTTASSTAETHEKHHLTSPPTKTDAEREPHEHMLAGEGTWANFMSRLLRGLATRANSEAMNDRAVDDVIFEEAERTAVKLQPYAEPAIKLRQVDGESSGGPAVSSVEGACEAVEGGTRDKPEARHESQGQRPRGDVGSIEPRERDARTATTQVRAQLRRGNEGAAAVEPARRATEQPRPASRTCTPETSSSSMPSEAATPATTIDEDGSDDGAEEMHGGKAAGREGSQSYRVVRMQGVAWSTEEGKEGVEEEGAAPSVREQSSVEPDGGSPAPSQSHVGVGDDAAQGSTYAAVGRGSPPQRACTSPCTAAAAPTSQAGNQAAAAVNDATAGRAGGGRVDAQLESRPRPKEDDAQLESRPRPKEDDASASQTRQGAATPPVPDTIRLQRDDAGRGTRQPTSAARPRPPLQELPAPNQLPPDAPGARRPLPDARPATDGAGEERGGRGPPQRMGSTALAAQRPGKTTAAAASRTPPAGEPRNAPGEGPRATSQAPHKAAAAAPSPPDATTTSTRGQQRGSAPARGATIAREEDAMASLSSRLLPDESLLASLEHTRDGCAVECVFRMRSESGLQQIVQLLQAHEDSVKARAAPPDELDRLMTEPSRVLVPLLESRYHEEGGKLMERLVSRSLSYHNDRCLRTFVMLTYQHVWHLAAGDIMAKAAPGSDRAEAKGKKRAWGGQLEDVVGQVGVELDAGREWNRVGRRAQRLTNGHRGLIAFIPLQSRQAGARRIGFSSVMARMVDDDARLVGRCMADRRARTLCAIGLETMDVIMNKNKMSENLDRLCRLARGGDLRACEEAFATWGGGECGCHDASAELVR